MRAPSGATILALAGLVVLGGAVAWWATFYGWLAAKVGGSLSEVTECLYLSSDACALLAGVGAMAGRMAYSPIALWLGIALLVAGLGLRSAQRRP